MSCPQRREIIPLTRKIDSEYRLNHKKNAMKIILSKTQWNQIGIKAGWTKPKIAQNFDSLDDQFEFLDDDPIKMSMDKEDYSKHLKNAVLNGRTEQVQWILENIKQTPETIEVNTEILLFASSLYFTDVVKLLIPFSEPEAHESEILTFSALYGYDKIVKLLIPVSDPKANDSRALRWAADKGNTEIVKMLIPVSDPEANEYEALRTAAQNGHRDVVNLLLPYTTREMIERLKQKYDWL